MIDDLADAMAKEFSDLLARHKSVDVAIRKIVKTVYALGAELADMRDATVCPKCGSGSLIIDTRDAVRRRRCKACSHRWTTMEVIKRQNYQPKTTPSSQWNTLLMSMLLARRD